MIIINLFYRLFLDLLFIFLRTE